jgi:hypothetical protein
MVPQANPPHERADAFPFLLCRRHIIAACGYNMGAGITCAICDCRGLPYREIPLLKFCLGGLFFRFLDYLTNRVY